jgi:hypothetical protein
VTRNPMFAPARKTARLSKVSDTSCGEGDVR